MAGWMRPSSSNGALARGFEVARSCVTSCAQSYRQAYPKLSSDLATAASRGEAVHRQRQRGC